MPQTSVDLHKSAEGHFSTQLVTLQLIVLKVVLAIVADGASRGLVVKMAALFATVHHAEFSKVSRVESVSLDGGAGFHVFPQLLTNLNSDTSLDK